MSNVGPASRPDWDLADRMRKALRHADIGVGEMASYLDVSRNTVGSWINGHITPSTQTVRLWAMRCGVDYEWLRLGDDAPKPGPGGRRKRLRGRDSNSQPSDYRSVGVVRLLTAA